MGRVTGGRGGYGHRIKRHRDDEYTISWSYDTHARRIRWQRSIERETNREGAERFAKRWGISMPSET